MFTPSRRGKSGGSASDVVPNQVKHFIFEFCETIPVTIFVG